MGRSTSFVETSDGTSLFYKDWGAGKPLVFVSGWLVSSDMWEYQMTYLSSHGLRCVAYDRRGHGRSSQPGHGYDYDTLADDLAAIINRLDLREVTLVGHSMGGGEIVRYMSRHGAGRVARIALVASTTPFLLRTADNPDGVDKGYFEELRKALTSDRPRWLAEAAPAFFGAGLPNCSVSSEMIQWGVLMCLQSSLKANIDASRAFAETDFRAEMRKITVPTLIVHGDKDNGAGVELTAKRSAKLIPGSQLKVYEGAPHGLFITHMDRLNSDLLEFAKG
jgi:pimeloyl-ACP methyl ester carboxylesterase